MKKEENNFKVRRVVTGNNDEGKSYFVSDGFTPGYLDFGYCINNEIWVDDPAKPDLKVLNDPAEAEKHRAHAAAVALPTRVFLRSRAAQLRAGARADDASAADGSFPFQAKSV